MSSIQPGQAAAGKARDGIPEHDMQRFWSKVAPSPTGDCLLWTAGKTREGYGKFRYSGADVYAHRFAYTALVAPIPPTLVIDHLCRTPSCINPQHLEPVTQAENVHRGQGPTARHACATHCLKGHPYSERNTRVRPDGRRGCRACERERERGAARREAKNAAARARYAAKKSAEDGVR